VAETVQRPHGAAERAHKRKSSTRARLLGRLTTNLRQVREPELRARLAASIEQLAQKRTKKTRSG
jgi:hypothetical protein